MGGGGQVGQTEGLGQLCWCEVASLDPVEQGTAGVAVHGMAPNKVPHYGIGQGRQHNAGLRGRGERFLNPARGASTRQGGASRDRGGARLECWLCLYGKGRLAP
ncbi:hypothetical protein G113_05754 [Aeromonas molluscorum 848]|uniref:Uncharacterized protein n=1 Tax=Aeromonas molluscorum 848 TaxID=1268236 RepID=R1H6C6_9GAMM|nr:hypothetical protein G113_05754 [Aeromonas molluscorum 848]